MKVENWFSPDDYPMSAVTGSETIFQSATQTLVDSNGKIIGCRIETPSTSPKVDALACGLILKRGRFEPARWTDGSSVPGIYRWVISFSLEGDTFDPLSDIEIGVERLPSGEKSPAYVQVTFATDAEGKIRECVGGPAIRKKSPNPLLVSAACSAVKAEWKPFTVLGSDGKPSRSVQNVIVKFTTERKR
jgi:hypothetical protein